MRYEFVLKCFERFTIANIEFEKLFLK